MLGGAPVPALQKYKFRQVAVLSLSYFVTFGSELAVVSVLPLLFKDTFNLSLATAGFVGASFGSTTFFARPAGGWLSDRFGRRKIMLLCMFGAAPGYLGMSFINAATGVVFGVAATFLCSLFVNAGNGAVYAMLPLIKRRLTGQIAGYSRRVRQCGRRAVPDLLLVRDAANILSCCFGHCVYRLGTDLYVRRESEGTYRRGNARRHGDHDRSSLTAMLGRTTSEIAISVGQHSIAGRKSRNDDSYGVLLPEKALLATKGIAMAIADGMSSSEAAKEASETCVRSFLDDYFATHPSWTVKTSVERVLSAANRWMHSQSEALSAEGRGMVSTFSGAVLKSSMAHIFHVGDSRIYLLRDTAYRAAHERSPCARVPAAGVSLAGLRHGARSRGRLPETAG